VSQDTATPTPYPQFTHDEITTVLDVAHATLCSPDLLTALAEETGTSAETLGELGNKLHAVKAAYAPPVIFDGPLDGPVVRRDFVITSRRYLSADEYKTVHGLTSFVFEDARFWSFPAATSAPNKPAKHHGGHGGLARHTWEVLAFALGAASAFPGRVDKVALAVGAIVHDCGKMDEYARTVIDGVEYWARATPLISHIMHGLQAWATHSRSACERRVCSPELRDAVTHMIGSHHGRREWGSPVVPSTLEACILHAADVQSLMLSGAGNPAARS
jgi:hypothetical protein